MARSLTIILCAATSIWTWGATEAADYISMGFHRNVCWPRPYIYPDRAAVAAPFTVMVNNGWRRQNLLGQHHFSEDSSKLTTAGELKLRWILTQAPIHRRSIFVSQTLDSEIDALRLEALQTAASKILPKGITADVRLTHLMVEGRSADTVDRINVRFYEGMPAPMLQPASTGTSGE